MIGEFWVEAEQTHQLTAVDVAQVGDVFIAQFRLPLAVNGRFVNIKIRGVGDMLHAEALLVADEPQPEEPAPEEAPAEPQSWTLPGAA
jgi:hypothetical protein